jgi:hypothetical protein
MNKKIMWKKLLWKDAVQVSDTTMSDRITPVRPTIRTP